MNHINTLLLTLIIILIIFMGYNIHKTCKIENYNSSRSRQHGQGGPGGPGGQHGPGGPGGQHGPGGRHSGQYGGRSGCLANQYELNGSCYSCPIGSVSPANSLSAAACIRQAPVGGMRPPPSSSAQRRAQLKMLRSRSNETKPVKPTKPIIEYVTKPVKPTKPIIEYVTKPFNPFRPKNETKPVNLFAPETKPAIPIKYKPGSWFQRMRKNSPVVCRCPGGQPAIGDDCYRRGGTDCSKCNPGYVIAKRCIRMGPTLPSRPDGIKPKPTPTLKPARKSCPKGYTFRYGRCLPNRCICVGGQSAFREECPSHGKHKCVRCFSHRVLDPTTDVCSKSSKRPPWGFKR